MFSPRGRSTGTSVPDVVEVVLDQRALGTGEQRRPARRGRPSRGGGPAAPCRRSRRAAVSRSVGGASMVVTTPAPRRAWKRTTIALRRAVRTDHPAVRLDLLDAGAVGERGDLGLQRGQLVDLGLHDRPDLHPHVVHVELRRPAAPRSVRARRIASRQFSTARSAWGSAVTAPSASRTTASWRTCARATSRWSAGLSLRLAVVEQHVLGRLEPGDGEVAQPPQVEASADHRVDAADQVVLHHDGADAVTARLRAEGEVVDRARPRPGRRRPRSGVRRGRRAAPPTSVASSSLAASGRPSLAGPGQVEVDDDLVTRGPGGDLSPRWPWPAARPGRASSSIGRRPWRPAGSGGSRRARSRPTTNGRPATSRTRRPVQVELAVVPPDQHLEHRLALRHAALEPLGEEAHDLLRDRGQRVDPRGPVGGVVVGERRDLAADAGQHAGAVLVDQRLVEPAEPDAAGQVADDREAQLGGPDQPLEELAHRPGQLVGRRRLGDPALQQAGDQVRRRRRRAAGPGRSGRPPPPARACGRARSRRTGRARRPAARGSARAARAAPRRGSAGRCGSAPRELCTRSSVCSSSPPGRLRLSSARSANRSSSSISPVDARRRPAPEASSRAAR